MTKANKIDLSAKISRKEIADILDITTNSARKMCESGRIPDKPIFINRAYYYDRKKIMEWLSTKPKVRKRTNKKLKALAPIVYNDEQRKIILFCQPSLLNRTNY
jgi:hypothetical protein